MPALRLQVLGPVRAWRGEVELDTGPRQQTYLLALLMAREGQLVTTSELIDLMWGDESPASALNVLHKYVGALRRLLEPDLAARGSGSFLLRRSNGYLFTAPTGVLDLAAFRELRDAAEKRLVAGEQQLALEQYAAALRLWRGSAGDGLDHTPIAQPIFSGLNAEFFECCETAARLAISLGRPALVLPALQRATAIAPLHEPLHTSLLLTLAAADHRAEALATYSDVRARLSDELGIDPGAALQAAGRCVAKPAAVELTAVPAGLRDAAVYLLNQVVLSGRGFSEAVDPADPAAIGRLPARPGVYVLLTPGRFHSYPGGSSTVLYIGGAPDDLRRHLGRVGCCPHPVNEWTATSRLLVTFIECDDVVALERDLLRVFVAAYRTVPIANS